MNWAHHIETLKAGQSVTIRPRGNSMTPLIRSGQECVIAPIPDGFPIRMGDIVLCRVRGRYLVHKVTGIAGRLTGGHCKVRISNNHGHVNGWIWDEAVFGKVIEVRT